MKTIKNIEYSYNHVKQRMKERYNFSITLSDYNRINTVIRRSRNHTKAISTDNNGDQEIYEYDIVPELKVLVVWSISKNRVTTVLPRRKK